MNGRRVVVVAAALAGIALTARLGWWQLARADEKLAWQATVAARDRLPPLDGDALAAALAAGAADAIVQRRVRLQGAWLGAQTIYLDNRMMRHRSGFYVLTPLRLPAGTVVLVQRGWAPRDAVDRSALPRVETPAGAVEVTGRLIARPPPTFALGAESAGPIRQNLDLQAYGRETGLALAPLVVQELGGAAHGLERDWPAPGSGVETNYGYAIQWFSLCALIAGLFLWFQVVRPLRSSRHARAAR